LSKFLKISATLLSIALLTTVAWLIQNFSGIEDKSNTVQWPSQITLDPDERYHLIFTGDPNAKIFEMNAEITGKMRIYINERYFWDNNGWDAGTPLRMSLNVTSRFAGQKNIPIVLENRSKKPTKIDQLKIFIDEQSNVLRRMANSSADFLYLSDREFILGDEGFGQGGIDAAALVQRLKALNFSNINYLIHRWTKHEWKRFKNFAEYSKNHSINLGVTVTKTTGLAYGDMLAFAKRYPQFKFLMIDDFSYEVKNSNPDKRAMHLANQIYDTKPDMSFIPVVYDLGDVKKKARSLAPYLDAIQWYHRGNGHPYEWFEKSVKKASREFKTTPILLGIYDTPHSSENSGDSSPEYSYLSQILAHQHLQGSNRFGLDGGWAGNAYGFQKYFDERHEGARQLQFLKRSGLKNLANGSFEAGSEYWWYNSSYPQHPAFATKSKPKTSFPNIGAKSKYQGRVSTHEGLKSFKISFPPQQSVETNDWNEIYGGYYGQLSQLVSLPEKTSPISLFFRYKVSGEPKGLHELVALVEGKAVWSKSLLKPSPWGVAHIKIPAPNATKFDLNRNFHLVQLRVAARKEIVYHKNAPVQVELDDVKLNDANDPIVLSESFTDSNSWRLEGKHSLQKEDIRSISDHCLQLNFDLNRKTRIEIDSDVSNFKTAQFEYRFESAEIKNIWLLYPILKQSADQLYFKTKPIAQLIPKAWHNLRIEIAQNHTHIFLDQQLVHTEPNLVSFMAKFGAFDQNAAGLAKWDNMQFQNHWRGGKAFTFNRKAFGQPINQNKSNYHGLDDLQPAINPFGAVKYVSKLQENWRVLQLQQKATATKEVTNDSSKYSTTFLYKYIGNAIDSTLYQSNDGVLIEQRGRQILLNGKIADQLIDEDVWYRFTLNIDKLGQRVELLRDWETKETIENIKLRAKLTSISLAGPTQGKALWDQIEMFQLD
jgi:hypothetical protein